MESGDFFRKTSKDDYQPSTRSLHLLPPTKISSSSIIYLLNNINILHADVIRKPKLICYDAFANFVANASHVSIWSAGCKWSQSSDVWASGRLPQTLLSHHFMSKTRGLSTVQTTKKGCWPLSLPRSARGQWELKTVLCSVTWPLTWLITINNINLKRKQIPILMKTYRQCLHTSSLSFIV